MSPKYRPPNSDCAPDFVDLPAGTQLTRIHHAGHPATQFFIPNFNSSARGGRFDSTPADRYEFLYAADDSSTAVAETLIRDLPGFGPGSRPLERNALDNKCISWIELKSELSLVNLRSGPNLGAIGQDTWLTTSPAVDYQDTRYWSSAIRAWAPTAAGMTWHSRFNPPGLSYIFFRDRCGTGCFDVGSATPKGLNSTSRIDRDRGLFYITGLLREYRVPLIEHR